MSLRAWCHQRIASTSAHRTVWRRRCVRHYASDTASEPEWFQKVRDELLSRRPCYHHEDLDPTHYEQLTTTLIGFAPSTLVYRAPSRPHLSLAELLTRFNVRVQSSKLLSDGTDPLHHPGEPWMRRMWAGGAVKVKPGLELGARAGSATPFRLKETVACMERIKDVRLQGAGEEAKIYVTIERRFAPRGSSGGESEGALSANNFKRVLRDNDWSDSLVKEERNLVFMKAKTGAELMSAKSGQELGETRYLKALEDPDYSYSLTPTRSLLFRYSAITYNAHLIHLDPTYARDVEGHRNILVHGPLTLTLMLQVLSKHLRILMAEAAQVPEATTSIEYRNIAPLYCDEGMRICVKKKKQTDTGHSWDVWIEGPTGGMAVKAVAHTVLQSAVALDRTSPKSVEGTTGADLPDVQTVASQAQDTLHALSQEDAGKEQLSQVIREERRQLIKQVQSGEPRSSQTATPKPYQEHTPFSRQWRSQWIGKSLRYLYGQGVSSPLCNNNMVERQSTVPPPTVPPSVQRPKPEQERSTDGYVPYSTQYRKKWVGKSLPHLYLWATSPLINTAVVARETAQRDTKPGLTKTSKLLKNAAASNIPVDSVPQPTAKLPTRRDHQRTSQTSRSPEAPPKIRSIKTDAPESTEGVFGFLNTASMQDGQDVKRLAAKQKREAGLKEKLKLKLKPKVRKIEGLGIRKADVNLRETERRRAHEKRGAGNAVLRVLQAAQGKGAASS
ncbi:hypothetical protein E8E12_004221 [Didymella heteroderae]|uniref:MaoC-like domain-containing protein n=1 Tax=Didymella heteroderae TaxID=1769908 RepID=A0A9P5BZ07_9PLEO|nr:hypothetical protein E8E12_004221 [Didymella heteroderae]